MNDENDVEVHVKYEAKVESMEDESMDLSFDEFDPSRPNGSCNIEDNSAPPDSEGDQSQEADSINPAESVRNNTNNSDMLSSQSMVASANFEDVISFIAKKNLTRDNASYKLIQEEFGEFGVGRRDFEVDQDNAKVWMKLLFSNFFCVILLF